MSHRIVKGLKWARLAEGGPNLPIRRPRGAKALGLRYERALAKALPMATHGQWWEFEDLNGHGWCQTDLILMAGELVVILEAKYSWVEKGHEQMEELYQPVVSLALGSEPALIQVCKNLRTGVRHVNSTLEDAVDQAKLGRSVLHWLGVGPLFSKPISKPLSISPGSPIGLPTREREFDPTA